MHPFRDDRRSKSIEEREEEYQRVRDRIFAHDVSSCFNCLFSAVLPSAVRQPPPPDSQLAGTKEAGARRHGSRLRVFLEEARVQGSDGKGARGSGMFPGCDPCGNGALISVSSVGLEDRDKMPGVNRCLDARIARR